MEIIKLKNNEKVIIRPVQTDDSEKLIQCLEGYIDKSPYIPLSTKEFRPTIAEEKKWINNFEKQDNSLLLVAEHEKMIIGNIDLTGGTRTAMMHTAQLGMGILPEWQGVGLGSALLRSAVKWAKSSRVVEIIWLQVFEENISAIKIYEKAGFVKCGAQKNFFRIKDQYFNNLIMSLDVS